MHETCNKHEEIIASIKDNMKDTKDLTLMVKLFKVFADETRIKILYAIKSHEVCVNDIASILNMTQSAISHQLAQLKDMNLIKGRREKQTIFYSLVDHHIYDIFNQALEHVKE